MFGRAPRHSPPNVDDILGAESSVRERLLPDRRDPADGTVSDGSGTKPMRADEARKLKGAAETEQLLQKPQPHPSAAPGNRDSTASDVAGDANVIVGGGVYLV